MAYGKKKPKVKPKNNKGKKKKQVSILAEK